MRDDEAFELDGVEMVEPSQDEDLIFYVLGDGCAAWDELDGDLLLGDYVAGDVHQPKAAAADLPELFQQ